MTNFILKYWPVVVGVIMCIIAFAETRVSVFHNSGAIEKVEQSNSVQWRKISDHESRISKLEGKLDD